MHASAGHVKHGAAAELDQQRKARHVIARVKNYGARRASLSQALPVLGMNFKATPLLQ